MGFNEIIIPANSVKNSDKGNIVDYGPMTGSTASFQIANGTIPEYMEKWENKASAMWRLHFLTEAIPGLPQASKI